MQVLASEVVLLLVVLEKVRVVYFSQGKFRIQCNFLESNRGSHDKQKAAIALDSAATSQ